MQMKSAMLNQQTLQYWSQGMGEKGWICLDRRDVIVLDWLFVLWVAGVMSLSLTE